VPLRWARELRRLRAWAAAAVPKVACPTLVLHGLVDRTAGVAGSLALVGRFPPGRATLKVFAGSPHVLTLGPDRAAVAGEVASFLAPALGGGGAAHSA
jgi:pimeloyl-ACP methyl ester carboxylesterase